MWAFPVDGGPSRFVLPRMTRKAWQSLLMFSECEVLVLGALAVPSISTLLRGVLRAAWASCSEPLNIVGRSPSTCHPSPENYAPAGLESYDVVAHELPTINCMNPATPLISGAGCLTKQAVQVIHRLSGTF